MGRAHTVLGLCGRRARVCGVLFRLRGCAARVCAVALRLVISRGARGTGHGRNNCLQAHITHKANAHGHAHRSVAALSGSRLRVARAPSAIAGIGIAVCTVLASACKRRADLSSRVVLSRQFERSRFAFAPPLFNTRLTMDRWDKHASPIARSAAHLFTTAGVKQATAGERRHRGPLVASASSPA